jgi:hypothetical protein
LSTGNFLYFLNTLEAILNRIYTNSLNIILCGDININYLDDVSTNKQKLNFLLASYNLCSIVDFPTRVTNISATAIDNFFKHKNEIFSIHSLTNGLSDHDAQIRTLNNIKLLNPSNYPYIRRDIIEINISELKLNLSHELWADVFTDDNDVNTMFNNFINGYLIIFNHSFPCKKYFPNQKNKIWLTNGIKISCAHKRELYMQSRSTNNPELIGYYRKSCKILSEIIKTAKKHDYNKLIANSKNKVKTTWNIIRSLLITIQVKMQYH